ncbi:unnamed protein product [Pleuronectes platessa]|uniref:Uncharacterized protein n=1 Tax=Pleuronectes platessa TaxID=8262 RepID=A0A9N7Z9W1_PLEPL|nr:unnamed protein product [Pleuronectes platessa]
MSYVLDRHADRIKTDPVPDNPSKRHYLGSRCLATRTSVNAQRASRTPPKLIRVLPRPPQPPPGRAGPHTHKITAGRGAPTCYMSLSQAYAERTDRRPRIVDDVHIPTPTRALRGAFNALGQLPTSPRRRITFLSPQPPPRSHEPIPRLITGLLPPTQSSPHRPLPLSPLPLLSDSPMYHSPSSSPSCLTAQKPTQHRVHRTAPVLASALNPPHHYHISTVATPYGPSISSVYPAGGSHQPTSVRSMTTRDRQDLHTA